MITKLNSDQLRALVARKLGRDADEVQETSRDDGFMCSYFDGGHDSVPIYIPLCEFLCAYYDVDPERVKLIWNAFDWTYCAEVCISE